MEGTVEPETRWWSRPSDAFSVNATVFVLLSADVVAWEKGVAYAEGQNLARLLMEAPANHVTPTAFAKTIEEKLAHHAEQVTVNKRFVHHSTP